MVAPGRGHSGNNEKHLTKLGKERILGRYFALVSFELYVFGECFRSQTSQRISD